MSDKQGFQLAGDAADIYEKVLVPLWLGRWADALLELVALQPGEIVLDVACGTGVTTRLATHAVGENGHVTGLDINASMLSIARKLAASGSSAIHMAFERDSPQGQQVDTDTHPQKAIVLREFHLVEVAKPPPQDI